MRLVDRKRLSTAGVGRVTEWVQVMTVCKNLPSGMRMDENVYWESKWYARNNRGLWCFREAAVIAVQVRVGSADRAFLQGLTTLTGGLSVVFFPSYACKACGQDSRGAASDASRLRAAVSQTGGSR